MEMKQGWTIYLAGVDQIQFRIFSKILNDLVSISTLSLADLATETFSKSNSIIFADLRKHSDFRLNLLSGQWPEQLRAYTWIWGPDDSYYRREFYKHGLLSYFPEDFHPLELRSAVLGMLLNQKAIVPKLDIKLPGDLRLDPSMQQLYYQNNSCALSSTEFRIFSVLIGAESTFVSRNDIRDRVWGKDFNITVRSIDSHISRMRRKIPDELLTIESDRNNGYHLKVK